MWVKPLVGLILCLVKKSAALQSTDRRTPKRFQQRRSSCCTGEKSPSPSIYIIRSGDDWLVGEEEKDALLKAPVGVDPYKPPRNGWQFFNKGKFDEDESLICSTQPELPCCSITVSLSGESLTKEYKSFREGKYESTGLMSMGRPVSFLDALASLELGLSFTYSLTPSRFLNLQIIKYQDYEL